MLDVLCNTLNTPMEISSQARFVSVPNDEESALPAIISPCPSPPIESLPSVTGRFVNIGSDYFIDPTVLGEGHHGSVRRCTYRLTGKQYAVKSIWKSHPTVRIEGLAREITLLQEMKHKNIIQLVDVYEDQEYVHLVMELCQGGELFDRIMERTKRSKRGCFTEEEAARILREILSAVLYMHQHNCVHRDIKPENIIFETRDDRSSIKIIDFGLARKHYGELGEPPMTTVVGTPYYVSPCVLNRSYDKSCDLWSIGVIAYTLLAGYPPFNGGSNREVYDAVRKGTYCFYEHEWGHLSSGARNFVAALLQKDPSRRMTVEQALSHPWLLNHTDGEESLNDIEVIYDRPPKTNPNLVRGYLGPRVKVI